MADDATYAPLATEWFWEILESSERKLQRLVNRLEQLSKEELEEFQYQYEDAKEFINPCYSEEMALYMEECSEDHGDDFAEWVVSHGRIFFDEVRNNPEAGQNYLDMYGHHESDASIAHLRWDCDVARKEYEGWQSPGIIARGVYEWRFGESLYDLLCERSNAESLANAERLRKAD